VTKKCQKNPTKLTFSVGKFLDLTLINHMEGLITFSQKKFVEDASFEDISRLIY
jgi:hypothetical protein